MESANREQARACLRKAQVAYKGEDFTKAERLARKSLKLCHSDEANGRKSRLYLILSS